ncbi:DUF6252 family protein [Flavobacterium sp.]|uniref:DUF6252 family protein n=1 Tax=Flavobacterium sp. TaxID=239 RepID=UPI002FD9E685
MKRFLPLFIIAIAFSSCQEDLKPNNPGFQGLKDDVFWRANDARAYVSATGKLTVEAYTEYEQVTLNTNSTSPGIYVLGTTNSNNAASYSSSFDDIDLEYGTIAALGPVSSVAVVAQGTGYTSGTSIATTGGTGSGLTFNITANASGAVTTATLSSRGNGYVAGDIVTIAGGDLNCKYVVVNVQNSNGEIEITEYDNLTMTVSGKFKFNAANANNSPFGGPILNFQYGEFYRVPIYPSL